VTHPNEHLLDGIVPLDRHDLHRDTPDPPSDPPAPDATKSPPAERASSGGSGEATDRKARPPHRP
jgi:hypothetical protein